MQRVIVALGPASSELDALSHRPHQQFQRLDTGRDLVTLEAADGRLAGPCPAGQAPLTKPMAQASFTDQLTWAHLMSITDM
jgi:hypothetical protein